ncbi:MAG: A24 family peptidase [Rhodobacter sp.]|nr:A24 family peptidase [Rhodobacter sp.]
MMLPDAVQMIPPIGVAGVMVAVIYSDLRQMRIPNVLSLLLLGLFVASQAIGGIAPDLWLRIAFSLGVFTAGFVAFVFRAIGGGDVKVLAVLALFVPLAHLPAVLLIFSGTLIAGTAIVFAGRRFLPGAGSSWAFLRSEKMPMGLPIGAAAIISLSMFGLQG